MASLMPGKVTEPSRIVTDPVMLSELRRQNIDSDYVEFAADYGQKFRGKSHPCVKFYRDKISNKAFAVISALPMVTPDGEKVLPAWEYLEEEGTWQSRNNIFSVKVGKCRTFLTYKPEGADRAKNLEYEPEIYIGGKKLSLPGFFMKIIGWFGTVGSQKINPKNIYPDWLEIDPFNENYHQNVLEWDYGIFKRRLRLIEGALLGSWLILEDPGDEIKINYKQVGDIRLRLGGAVDANGISLPVTLQEDAEIISAETLKSAAYPIKVGDSLTAYSTASDDSGHSGWQANYAAAHDAAAASVLYPVADEAYIQNANNSGVYGVCRGFLFFDTTVISSSIHSAVLSLYGSAGAEGDESHSDIGIVEGVQHDPVVVNDYGDEKTKTTIGHAAYYDYDNGWAGAYRAITLNATGIGWINGDGDTRFCVRVKGDIDNSTPVFYNRAYYYTNEKGDGYKPKLVVEYGPDAPTGFTASDGDSSVGVLLAWTKSTYGISYMFNRDGVDDDDWLGDVDKCEDRDADPPVITSGDSIVSKNRYFNYVKLNLENVDGVDGTTHTFKVKCKDADGAESEYSDTDTGYRAFIESGLSYQWQRSAADSAENYADIAGGVKAKYWDNGAPAYPSARYWRCTISSFNIDDYYSTVVRGYRRDPTLPPVLAKPAIIIKNLDGDTLCHVVDASAISMDESVNLLKKLEFIIPTDSEALDYIDEDNEFWLYFDNELNHIYKLTRVVSEMGSVKKISCRSIGQELVKSIILDGYSCTVASSKLPSDVLTDLLAYQEVESITLGGVDEVLDLEYIAVTAPAGSDIWAACKIVREVTGGYLNIEVDPEDTTKREIYLRIAVNSQSGQQITVRKNMTSLSHTKDYIELFNRLYPIGSSIKLSDIDYTRQDTTPETDASYAYIRLRNQYEAYDGWTAEGAALPGNITIEKPTGNWFSPAPFTTGDQYGNYSSWVIRAGFSYSNLYDENTQTLLYCGSVYTNPVNITNELRVFCPATTTIGLRFKALAITAAGQTTAYIVVRVQSGGTWDIVYNGAPLVSEWNNWFNIYFSSRAVTGVSLQFISITGSMMYHVYEIGLWDPVGLDNDTANWKQGADERTCRITIGSYTEGVGYIISYTHADYLIDLTGITDRRQIRSKYQTIDTADLNELIERGRQALTEGNKTINSIDVGVIDLSQYEGYDLDALILGSIVRIIDKYLDIDEEQQIVRVCKTDLHQPQRVIIEMAKRTQTLVNLL